MAECDVSNPDTHTHTHTLTHSLVRAPARYDPRWLRARTAVVGQEPVLFSGTIEANILYAVCGRALLPRIAVGNRGKTHGGGGSGALLSRGGFGLGLGLVGSGRSPQEVLAGASPLERRALRAVAAAAAATANASDFIGRLPLGMDTEARAHCCANKGWGVASALHHLGTHASPHFWFRLGLAATLTM